jgi:leader peptidase (prepilin peptidase)/N-methyltransferase
MVDGVELINGWDSISGWIGPVVAGPVIGSFCGVLIMRLPAGRDFARGRSACPACHHRLAPRDLVPLLSFLALRGRCRFCAAPIAPLHLWIELAALALAAWAAAAGERGALLWAGSALAWTLLTLGWIDAVCLRLPDLLTLPLLFAGLTEAWLLEPDALPARAFGAALGYSLFVALAWLYRRLRGREGLGGGDAKLLAAGGAWVGAGLLPDVLLGAALSGICWISLRRADPSARLPFGPFLAASIWLVWLYA